jgi:glycosyltransferase involved in cell wall biosynthesis
MRPSISVIVNEYRPRGYLKYAINSIRYQTLERGLYELIVIKKFKDPCIDRTIETLRGKIVYEEKRTIGYRLAKGIEEAEGDVLVFLKDDDAFVSKKLEYIYKYVCSRDDIGYYHHLAYMIDEKNRLLGKSTRGPTEAVTINPRDESQVKRVLRKYGVAFSLMSATIVRRELVTRYLEQLKTITISPDIFMFLASLNSDYLLIHEPLNLSFYRMHGQQASHPILGGHRQRRY